MIVSTYVLFNHSGLTFRANESDTIPAAPTNLSTQDNSDKTAINLQWTDNSTNETGFVVERTIDMMDNFSIIANLPTNTVRYIDPNPSGQRFFYRIKAKNSAGESGYSAIATPNRMEQLDLLKGTGAFETSTNTSWTRNINNNWVQHDKASTANFTVADGWLSFLSEDISDDQATFQVNSANGFSGNSQLMQLNSGWSGSGSERMITFSMLSIGNAGQDEIHPGDTVLFEVDKIQTTGWKDIPAANHLKYTLDINSCPDSNCTSEGHAFTEITPSDDIQSQSVKVTTRLNDTNIHAHVIITFDGPGMEAYSPGIRFDDAKLLVQRAGQSDFQQVLVPAPRVRTIMTQNQYLNDDSAIPPYDIAKDYDAIQLATADKIPPLRYYNPNIKLFIFSKLGFDDSRTAYNQEPYSDRFFDNFVNVLNNHLDWLTPFDPKSLEPPSKDNRQFLNQDRSTNNLAMPYRAYAADGTAGGNGTDGTPLNYVFNDYWQRLYWPNMTNTGYFDALAQSIIDRVKKYKVDGIWIDNSTDGYEFYNSTSNPDNRTLVSDRSPDVMQNYHHYVFQKLRAAGINDVIVNSTARHIDLWPNMVYFNPFWTPDSQDPSLVKDPWKLPSENFSTNKSSYSSNSLNNTANIMFDEWSYLTHGDLSLTNFTNNYYLWHWLGSIRDNETIEQINQSISDPSKKRKVYDWITGIDNATDPAYNPVPEDQKSNLNKYDTGWANFAITSFLLSSNNDSYIGLWLNYGNPGNSNTYGAKLIPYDYSITAKLGTPIAERKVFYSNASYSKNDQAIGGSDDTTNFTAPDQDNTANKNKVLQYRDFSNGTVVVNGSGTSSQIFILPRNYVDDLGRSYPSGTQITLLPHSGRIFLNYPLVSDNLTNEPAQRNGYYVDKPIVELDAASIAGNNIGSITYSLDGGAEQSYTGPITIEDGCHSLTYYATDSSNVKGVIKTEQFVVKATPPTKPTILAKYYSASQGAYLSHNTISGSASSDTSTISLGGTTILPSGTTWQATINSLPFGQKQNLSLVAQDAAGNIASDNLYFLHVKNGDINADNQINLSDFSLLMANWGTAKNYLADFNSDGKTDLTDMALLMANWEK